MKANPVQYPKNTLERRAVAETVLYFVSPQQSSEMME
jgi:hypothetical protein